MSILGVRILRSAFVIEPQLYLRPTRRAWTCAWDTLGGLILLARAGLGHGPNPCVVFIENLERDIEVAEGDIGTTYR